MERPFFRCAFIVIVMFGLEACMEITSEDQQDNDAQSAGQRPEFDARSSFDNVTATTNAASDCPAGFFCIWENQGFSGGRRQFQDSGCQNLSNFAFNDLTSSWLNRNGNNYRVYRNANCGDLMFVAQSGANVSNLAGSGTNDQASSICRPPANVGGPCP